MYRLSNKSKGRLIGVHPDLIAVVNRAIEITQQDFTVFEGVRTIAKQKENVKKGVSTTVSGSRHLIGKNGYAHAVDLVPYIGGQLKWDWEGCYKIAEAVKQASIELGIPIRWGGVWDKNLSDIVGTAKQAQLAYVDMRLKNKQRAFADGPHFELPLSEQYPQFD